MRPLLFRRGGGDAEAAHRWTLDKLGAIDRSARLRAATARAMRPVDDPVTLFGVEFANRVGLAAGMAKNGEALRAWRPLGFGFAEIGTVTWRAQPGNPRPRLFRLPRSQALINRMGFNNYGTAALVRKLQTYASDAKTLQREVGMPIGISLGKSKITPLEDAVGDYVSSLLAVRDFASYVAVNVSSPNTPGLRSLQDKGFLRELLDALRAEASDVPLLVKIAPELTHSAIDDVLDVCRESGAAGLIATNTTTGRDGVEPSERRVAEESGGLSGRPLTELSRQKVAYLRSQVGSDLPIIGVGGIGSADDAARMVDAGADLVQIYSGLVFSGPTLVRAAAARLAEGSR
ncbi:quinone-dependent dihydroorotate dehydrogenase [Epidermidibacterium keratini]|uniref:Dihydroorotate dehydrogenase (quinone) n=1 Tax=Epidermidibacterium keratini TaxID=1891644 RepID=A0A7L4YSQ1_9ACTN|nr:quinone-dependent dihydroorotate dehydrogenase [Epidermidibacterium keratini]